MQQLEAVRDATGIIDPLLARYTAEPPTMRHLWRAACDLAGDVGWSEVLTYRAATGATLLRSEVAIVREIIAIVRDSHGG